MDCVNLFVACWPLPMGFLAGQRSRCSVLACPETRPLNAFAREKLETSAETNLISNNQEPSITFWPNNHERDR